MPQRSPWVSGKWVKCTHKLGDAGCSHKGARAATCLLRRDSTLEEDLEDLALGRGA